jgi:general secretion pathway protein A
VLPSGGFTLDALTMYKDHFLLRAMPFSMAPDPAYFYLSNQHRDALTHLRHAVDGEGSVVLLSGEIGAGKTTVCRRLLDELPGHVQVALIHNPRVTPHDLLLNVCRQFGIAGTDDRMPLSELESLLARHAAEAGRAGRAMLLIIDEAQGLSPELLEQLARLNAASQLEGGGLRLVLIGQPELNELLARPENAGFNQCITMRYHLGPLARDDVAAYLAHRLSVAGGRKPLIPRGLVPRLHRMSQGIPRVINLICDRALLGAYVLGKQGVNRRILEEAWGEAVGGAPPSARTWPLRRAWAVIGAIGLLAGGAVFAVVSRSEPMQGVLMPSVPTDASSAGLDPKDPSDWPDGMGGKHSESLAYQALLRRWDVAPAQGASPCAAASQQGLMCVRGRDDFEAVRRLNLPAVLQLVDRSGKPTYVTLVQVHKEQAVLQLGATLRRVSVAVLESQWTHHYTVVWRPPPALKGGVEPGTEGPAVDWLRDRLARLKGVDAKTLPATLNGALKNSLQEFQSREGLASTGAGDLRTLMHLASRTEPLAPSLDAQQCGS